MLYYRVQGRSKTLETEAKRQELVMSEKPLEFEGGVLVQDRSKLKIQFTDEDANQLAAAYPRSDMGKMGEWIRPKD